MQFHAFLGDLFGLTDSEWGKAIAENLIASLIFASTTFLVTRAFYRSKLTDKDIEIEKARLGEQKALRKAEALMPLAAANIETAFANYEREERDGNYERAAAILKDYFERERQNLARLTGTLGDWFAAFLSDEGAAGMVKRAQGFYSIALFAEPGNEHWRRAAAELSMATSIAKLRSGVLPNAPDGYDDHFAYAMGSNLDDAAALVVALMQRCEAMDEEGNYYAAYLLARRGYRAAARRFGDLHAVTLAAQDLLANSLYLLGLYKQALSNALAVLEAREKTLGKQHLDTGGSCNLAGLIYRAQNHYEKAEALFKRSLAICEAVLGADNPNTTASLNNLATLYTAQGRYQEAEPLLKRALAIREKVLDPDNPNTATSLNNLAALYLDQGRYEEAEPLFRRALAIREKVLETDHPDIANSLHNLAVLYRDQSRYEEAEPLSRRALAMRETALGSDHPSTAASLNNLAALYLDQSRYEEAEPLFRRALAFRETAFGADHSEAAGSLDKLATLCTAQGRYEEAEPLLKRALAIREKVLGPDHPSTAGSLTNLAGLYRSQSRYEEAESLYKRVLAIVELALGPDNPSTAASLHNLAGLYLAQGRYKEAEPLFRRALAIYETKLGANNPQTLNTKGNLVQMLAGESSEKTLKSN